MCCNRLMRPEPFSSLLGRVVVKRFQNFSIDPALMSVAGSALLFGIGTLALHRSAELSFLLCSLPLGRSSGRGVGICPAKLGTFCPHAVRDNRHSTCPGDD